LFTKEFSGLLIKAKFAEDEAKAILDAEVYDGKLLDRHQSTKVYSVDEHNEI